MSEEGKASNTAYKKLLELLRAEAPEKSNKKDEKRFNSDFAQTEIRNQKALVHLQGCATITI